MKMDISNLLGFNSTAKESAPDFNHMVQEETDYRAKLHAFINGLTDIKFTPESLARDNQCQLGRWLHDEGEKKFAKEVSFTELKLHHAMYHLYMARILVAFQQGDKRMALHMLAEGEFPRCLQELQGKIEAFHKKLAH